ncbi:MAG: PLP-dependent aminotransferase family protein [Solirubrobacterales bacterium]|nr:PLP-dependent aminotransferase family protein [Solirubrobacterales bacterium]
MKDTNLNPQKRSGRGDAVAIERYGKLFAARTRSMTSSAMRDLMSITERPEVISLAGGLPDTSTFPKESYAALMSKLAAEELASALQYGPTEGLAAARECIRFVMAAEGITVDPDDVIVTTGGQQVLDLVCKVLIDPGDVIVAEGPTYPGAVSAFTSYEARVEQVPIDADGMDPELLRERLVQLDAEGARPKFIYLIPNFQNPSGVTLSAERRKAILEIAREWEILILEDNPYGLLRYEEDPIPSILEMDGGESVIYLGTFSKILSPGIRLGWVTAPRPVLEKLNLAKQAADLCASSLAQHFVAAYIGGGGWPEYMASLRRIYRDRRDVMLESLTSEMPEGTTWVSPAGGLFVWATLPDYIDTTDLLARALRENVAFVPGRAAWVNGDGGSSLRLNFSGADSDRIREGIRRIGMVVGEQVDLYETMMGRSAGAAPAPAQSAPSEGARVVPIAPRKRRASGAEG